MFRRLFDITLMRYGTDEGRCVRKKNLKHGVVFVLSALISLYCRCGGQYTPCSTRLYTGAQALKETRPVR